jgi:hypothetical protein
LLAASSDDDESAIASPKHLDADAQENEGRQADDDVDAVIAQQGNGALGEMVADVDRDRESDDPSNRRTAEQRQLRHFERSGRPLAAKRDRDRDRSWADREWHGQGIEGIVRGRTAFGTRQALILNLGAAVQQLPAKRDQHQTARDPDSCAIGAKPSAKGGPLSGPAARKARLIG